MAINLPPKAMVWENAEGKVFLSYNSADFLFDTIYARHGVDGVKEAMAKVAEAYAAIANEATQ